MWALALETRTRIAMQEATGKLLDGPHARSHQLLYESVEGARTGAYVHLAIHFSNSSKSCLKDPQLVGATEGWSEIRSCEVHYPKSQIIILT